MRQGCRKLRAKWSRRLLESSKALRTSANFAQQRWPNGPALDLIQKPSTLAQRTERFTAGGRSHPNKAPDDKAQRPFCFFGLLATVIFNVDTKTVKYGPRKTADIDRLL